MKTEYLSIGKVAKLKNISIKALRYYDEIGIFVPAYINAQTNYRYYTKEQLPMLDAVHLCLQLGIPLKTLPAYVKNEQFDFHALLSDTRKLAEEKIHGIQLALEKIESSATASHAESAQRSTIQDASEASTPITLAQDEYLLALPLLNEQLPPFDGFILKLFIFARQKNIILENPSCILYRCEHSTWQKYLCLKVIPGAELSPETFAPTLKDSEFCLFKIPAGEYLKKLRKKSIELPFKDSISTFGNYSEDFAASLLEKRLEDAAPGTEYQFELITLNTYDLSR